MLSRQREKNNGYGFVTDLARKPGVPALKCYSRRCCATASMCPTKRDGFWIYVNYPCPCGLPRNAKHLVCGEFEFIA